MKSNLFIGLILGAGLTACSSYFVSSYKTNTTAVDAKKNHSEWVESFIKPYKDSLDADMGKRIAYAPVDLVVARPSGNLNNWVADATLKYTLRNNQIDGPVMCIFNTGGIRANLNKGNITLGDIYKIMPFDNRVVILKMPMSALKEIETYLRISGGEPISNAILDENGLKIINSNQSETFTLITSDFLAAGGDKMYFMKKNTEVLETGWLMRDVLIDEARFQDSLMYDNTNRIKL